MNNEISDNVKFPIRITFEDGCVETYHNQEDLECNLEEFDSAIDTSCKVRDAEDRSIHLVLKLLSLKELKIKE